MRTVRTFTRWLGTEWGRTANIFEYRNAVDNELFSRAVDPELVADTRRAFGLPGKLVACYVGRLEPEKGFPILLAALARTPEEIGIVIVGSGSERAGIERAARNGGVEKRVHLTGYVEQEHLAAYYRASDCLVIPSVTTPYVKETWGLVANEAMNAGIPVIATDAVGAAEGGLVVDGLTGIVVRERHVADLARAMTDLFEDPAARRKLGLAAAEHVKHWNYDTAAFSFEQAVTAAIGRAPNRPCDDHGEPDHVPTSASPGLARR